MRWILLVALLLGCRSQKYGSADTDLPVATDPTDEAPDTDTAATDTDTDTDVEAGPYDGTYTGSFTLTFREWGIASWTETCTVPLTLTVVAASSPQVTGSGSCTLAGNISGPVDLAFTGGLTGTLLSGDLTVTRYSTAHRSAWSGELKDPDGLDGSFDDSFSQGSGGMGWQGDFQLTK